MSNVYLKFNLPEEKFEADIAHYASKFYFALYDVEQAIRSRLKYHQISDEEERFLLDLQEILSIIEQVEE